MNIFLPNIHYNMPNKKKDSDHKAKMKAKKEERKQQTLLHKQEKIDQLQSYLETIDEFNASYLMFPSYIKTEPKPSILDILRRQ